MAYQSSYSPWIYIIRCKAVAVLCGNAHSKKLGTRSGYRWLYHERMAVLGTQLPFKHTNTRSILRRLQANTSRPLVPINSMHHFAAARLLTSDHLGIYCPCFTSFN